MLGGGIDSSGRDGSRRLFARDDSFAVVVGGAGAEDSYGSGGGDAGVVVGDDDEVEEVGVGVDAGPGDGLHWVAACGMWPPRS